MKEKKERNKTIDVIKGICAILVIINHSEYSDQFYRCSLFPFWVYAAVPVFMFLSGYVRSIKAVDIEEAYQFPFISKQLFRLLLPFIPVFIIEEMISLAGAFSIKKVLFDLLDGGHGPGSYYVVLMIQFVFIFPFLHHMIRKYDRKGLLLCLVFDLGYEFMKTILGFPSTVYRVLLFRYLFVIAWGIYFYKHRKDDPDFRIGTILVLIGAVYIYATGYLNYQMHFFEQWPGTALPACLFWIPLLMYVIRKFRMKNSVLELFGKASYHIFLTQMFYFRYVYSYLNLSVNYLVKMFLNTVICLTVGSLFYLLEQYLLKKWLDMRNGNSVIPA